jgi:hypothetical protein
MTPDEAKTILNLCPPGEEAGSDVPGLAEALALTAANPELAGWWEEEKNFEEQYSRKLAAITPPAVLAATIMRGGATIFFASRLIAESTGETLAELPPTSEDGPSKTSPLDLLAPEKVPTTPTGLTWWWRAAVLSVVLLVILLLALLIVLPSSSSSSGPGEAQLPGFTHYATQLATLPPPPQSGQTLADLQNYLAANHAPNPPDPLGLSTNPQGATAVYAGVETWNTHTVTHYVVQNGSSLTHLFILNQAEFPHDDISSEIYQSTVDTFHVQTWSGGGFICLAVKP